MAIIDSDVPSGGVGTGSESVTAVTTTGSRRQSHSKPVLRGAMVWVGFLIVISLTVQWLPIHNYVTAVGIPLQGPHWGREFLGTDYLGRSMISRLAYGARISILISFSATAISAVVGSALGLLGAYFQGTVSITVDSICNSLLAVPNIVLLLVIVLSFGTSIPIIIIAISIHNIPAFMRLMRTNALSHISREYVLAARTLAASPWRIIARELLPNAAPALVTFAVLVLPANMIAEGALSFLGLGVQSPIPSWGQMIALGAQDLEQAPWAALFPCLTLALTVFSFNTVGDYLRTRVDVRDSNM